MWICIFFYISLCVCLCHFFFNYTPTTMNYTYCPTLSLHDALPVLAEAFLQSQGIESANRDYAQAWLETVVAGDTEAALATLTEMLREGDLPPPATDPAGVEATRP